MRKVYKYPNATVIVEGEPNMENIKAATQRFVNALWRDPKSREALIKTINDREKSENE